MTNTDVDVKAAGTTAMVLEVVPGYFGMLGLGHTYGTGLEPGVYIMLGWWAYLFLAFLGTIATGGLALWLFTPIYLIVPIISGVRAKAATERTGSTGDFNQVGMVAGGGCVVIVALLVASALLMALIGKTL